MMFLVQASHTIVIYNHNVFMVRPLVVTLKVWSCTLFKRLTK